MGACTSAPKEIIYTQYTQVTKSEHLLKVLLHNYNKIKDKLVHYPKDKIVSFMHQIIKKDIRGRFGSFAGQLIGAVTIDGAAYLTGERGEDIQYNKTFDHPIKNSVMECFNNKRAVIDIGPMFEKVSLNDIDANNVFLFGFSNALSFQYFMEEFSAKIVEFPEKTEANLKLILESMILIQNAYDKWIRRDNKEEIYNFMTAYLENSVNVFTVYDGHKGVEVFQDIEQNN